MISGIYQDSLNLPKTDFPMKASLPIREPQILEVWQNRQLYTRLRAQMKGKPHYVLHDGPPYANGHLHVGHAVNKVLKDIILKAKTLSGVDAAFVPGWDCHGLPIELNVEKALKASGKSYTSSDFRQACREYAQGQIDIQREEFKRLGILADWEHPYSTMDFSFEARVIRGLKDCLTTGYVRPGLKPVHWCVDCASALAELEVEYRDKTSLAIDVRFRVIRNELFPGEGPLSIPIWTTTPWTLPANEAVALGSRIEYSLIQTQEERLIIATPQLAICLQRYGIADYQVLGCYRLEQLIPLSLQHPLEAREVPLVEMEGATDIGTGAVHIAPAHGQEDYQIGQNYQLPLRNCVNEKGCYHTAVPILEGQSILQANPAIILLLKAQNNLLCEDIIVHSYPHCWRHKAPLIFLSTSQWFISLQHEHFRQRLEQAIEGVWWIPEWGKSRMRAMLGSDDKPRLDWCISRQRHWGVPLPLFIHKNTGEWHSKTLELLEIVAANVEKEGIEAWYRLRPEDLLGDEAGDYQKLNDTLDVWFDSGLTHQAILKQDPRLHWPADLYLEGADQFRGWFQSSLLTGVALEGQSPYRAVFAHGFMVDDQGRKMSKSLGNVMGLDQIISQWGADILRLWIAATDTRTEISVSNEILQRITEAYRRIRNTIRFLLANLHDFDPVQNKIEPKKLLSLDRWILARTATLQRIIQNAYEDFNFHIVYQIIHQFCINELGSFYFSVLKDRQYTMLKDSQARRSGQTALYQIAKAMLSWIAPILSFTAEEAWSHLPGHSIDSIFLTTWPTLGALEESTDPLANFYQEAGSCEACWDHVMQVRHSVNKAIEAARASGQIGSGLEVSAELTCQPSTFLARLLQQLEPELHFILLTSEVRLLFKPQIPKDDCPIQVDLSVNSTAQKCSRCWHRRIDVGQVPEHPELCLRCVKNLPGGLGEQRYYA